MEKLCTPAGKKLTYIEEEYEYQRLRVQVITCQFWMMSVKVVFSFCKLFWSIGERNREKEEF